MRALPQTTLSMHSFHPTTPLHPGVTPAPSPEPCLRSRAHRACQDEIASLKPMVVEPNTPLADELTLRETLLRQFSLVWAEDGQAGPAQGASA